MRINWEKLKIFYQVASAGSFTRAAELNNKTVAALSSMIKTFEDELQVKLFIRKDNGVELTDDGKQLFKAASHISNIVKAEEDILSNKISSLSGHLRIMASSGFTSMYISKFIDKFMLQHPRVNLEFLASNEMSLQEKLSGDILIHPYMENLNGYKQEHLLDLNLRLYASKEYIAKFGAPKSVKDLDKHQLISFIQNRKYPVDLNWHLTTGRNARDMRKPFLQVDENFGRCRICSKGVGIISVPKQHPEIQEYGLIEVLPDLEGPSLTYDLIIDEVMYGYKKIKAFATFLKQELAGNLNNL